MSPSILDFLERTTPPADDSQVVQHNIKDNKKTENDTNRLPHNIEAEQAVIGAILLDNDVFEHVSTYLQEQHFYEPANKVIFEAISRLIRRQRLATPVTVCDLIRNHPVFSEVRPQDYLARLASSSVGVSVAGDYAKMIFDMATLRSLVELGTSIADKAKIVQPDLPASEQIVHAEQLLFTIATTGRTERGFIKFQDALNTALQSTEAAYKRDGKLAGVATKLRDLDKKLGGLHPSDLLILAGRPSMGKTALATNIAFNVAMNHRMEMVNGQKKTVDGAVVAFFSLEMSSEQLASRILAEQTEISSERLRRGQLNESEFSQLVNAAQFLETIPLFIDDTPAITMATLAARCRRLKRQHDLGMIVVDYLQLIRPGTMRKSDNRTQELSEITQGLKALAKELHVPVLALSQLSRAVESRDDKRPQLSDLRESGSIEQDSDVVMFVFREEYYVGRREPREGTVEHEQWQRDLEAVKNIGEVIIGKQRHGPIGTVKLAFQSEYTRFSDLADPSFSDNND